jgi:hypothetical protein
VCSGYAIGVVTQPVNATIELEPANRNWSREEPLNLVAFRELFHQITVPRRHLVNAKKGSNFRPRFKRAPRETTRGKARHP